MDGDYHRGDCRGRLSVSGFKMNKSRDGMMTHAIATLSLSLASQEWKACVCVLVQGAAWQFKGWEWDQPVTLFQNGEYRVHSLVRPSVVSFLGHSFGKPFARSSAHPFVRLLGHLFIRPFAHTFLRLANHSLVEFQIYLVVDPFIHSFVCLSICLFSF